ncbi:MAG TPA: hypothetical protein GX399_01985 [Xanthomonadaceae bacterium]|nr:hypothetical protein [Xanthomonadaceae bacterium]
MNWQQSRLHYPHQWLLIEAVQAHTEADRRIVDNLAVIGAYPDSTSALRDYARLHHAAPDRELYVAHTDRAELDITERCWLGIRQSA